MAGFRYWVWDPPLIISQIVTLQCVFYAGLGFVIWFIDVLFQQSLSLEQLFSYGAVHLKSAIGIGTVLAYMLNACISASALWYFVARTKQCLDFSCTTHFYHLLACWCYNGRFPWSPGWWLLNVCSATIMCVLGEYLCIRTEMKAIPLLGNKAEL
ncbi:protein SYS1 homolog [Galendromus occidentalis]|uniref:Protein SYS1 homolog n=1 Tax=Galendromus occidentalis TaxID=34638 RepID=A0AAJ6VXW9_9ACAR|nr:protein SYS1 homolog [Galendromus occidentalis]